MRRIAILFLLCSLPSLADGRYSVERQSTLAASAEVITVKLAAGTGKRLRPQVVSIYAEADLEFTIERDGTYASGTDLTVNKHATRDDAVTATATYGTGITGTTVLNRYTCPSFTPCFLGPEIVGNIEIRAGEAFTVRTASATTTVTINILWHKR